MDPDGEFSVEGYGALVGPWRFDSEHLSNGSLGFSSRTLPPRPNSSDYKNIREYIKASFEYDNEHGLLPDGGGCGMAGATFKVGSRITRSSGPIYKTTAEATKAALKLGYKKTKFTVHGQAFLSRKE